MYIIPIGILECYQEYEILTVNFLLYLYYRLVPIHMILRNLGRHQSEDRGG